MASSAAKVNHETSVGTSSSGLRSEKALCELQSGADQRVDSGVGKGAAISVVAKGRQVQKGNNYVRLTFNAATESGRGKRRTVWANKLGTGKYQRMDDEGSRTNEYIVLGAGDLVEEKPARLNLHYGGMELVP